MSDPIHRRLAPAVRRFVVWCLLVAVPVFGVSGTLVELLGTKHMHRAASSASAGSATDADPMRGWVDMRRAPGLTTTAPGALSTRMLTRSHAHSHALFARHHHDRDDASVIALDGGVLGGEASDDGGGSGGSFSHVMAFAEPMCLSLGSASRFAWLDAAAAKATPWTAEGPMRPPKA